MERSRDRASTSELPIGTLFTQSALDADYGVVAAPGRVRRFATVDWLLVGFTCGAAFLAVEEIQRRLVRPVVVAGRPGWCAVSSTTPATGPTAWVCSGSG